MSFAPHEASSDGVTVPQSLLCLGGHLLGHAAAPKRPPAGSPLHVPLGSLPPLPSSAARPIPSVLFPCLLPLPCVRVPVCLLEPGPGSALEGMGRRSPPARRAGTRAFPTGPCTPQLQLEINSDISQTSQVPLQIPLT